MRNIIRKIFRNLFYIVLILLVIYLVVSNLYNIKENRKEQTIEVIIDADTGREIDGLFAVVRLLTEPSVKVNGLLSSQYRMLRGAPDSSATESRRINERILSLLGMHSIPRPAGAEDRLRFEGKPEPQPSPASKFIIRKAREHSYEDKLNLVLFGPCTNLASAILEAPDIVPRIRCYFAGFRFYPETEVWDKNEFNIRNDLDAADVLLNTSRLELHIMPANISDTLVIFQSTAFANLRNKGDIWNYLVRSWEKNYPGENKLVMQDIALAEALIEPGFCIENEAVTPPENTERTIHVFTEIDADEMIRDFWKGIRDYQDKQMSP